MSINGSGAIINLNVGGQNFAASRQTLTAIPDTFFSSLLADRISSLCDANGAIFIDRDPGLFAIILNYLRSGDIDLGRFDVRTLRNEAEFYCVGPLIRRLELCDEVLQASGCGSVLFHACLKPPAMPMCFDCSWLPHSLFITFKIFTAMPKNDATPSLFDAWASCDHPLRVQHIRAHLHWIAVAYTHTVVCFALRDSTGWKHVCTSPFIAEPIEHLAVNAKVVWSDDGDGEQQTHPMVAISCGASIRLWRVSDGGSCVSVGVFDLNVRVGHLLFVGSQLVALSTGGKIGVWHSMTQQWQAQDVEAISSFDTAGSILLLGCVSGRICFVDMQKFPQRLKDKDLLVTELYRDPSNDPITSISVYLTSKTSCLNGNWLEIAYGTSTGLVRVIVQHPDTVGNRPQLLQTFSVHQSAVTKVRLSDKHLISVCSDYNHVRTWRVTRFRGMISAQPGPTPEASFKVIILDGSSDSASSDIGPFGEQDDDQLFVQKLLPDIDRLYVRSASDGRRVCVIRSIDSTSISAFCMHDCEIVSPKGCRPRRFLLSGHTNGVVQMWDISTGLELSSRGEPTDGGPSPSELLRLLDSCDLGLSDE